MRNHNYAILLAGGQGSRFWPQSRTLEPKQFLALHKDKSLFEQTILRIRPLIPNRNIFIATSDLYRNQIIESAGLYGIPETNLIFEPDGKNTAPSIGVCAAVIHARDPKACICVLPCDHLIKNPKNFLNLLRKAGSLCSQSLVIFGIKPSRPATGYGYIQVARRTSHGARLPLRVKRFTEKPDLKTAQKFLKSGDYYWNSGIFVGSASIFLSEYRRNLPHLYRLLTKVKSSGDIKRIWSKVAPISFDYGILEKASRVIMLPASDVGWSDLGSWQAWDEILTKDKHGNLFKADVVNVGSKNITVVGANRLIATIGLEGLIVVDTPDATLITRKDMTEDVKKVVEALKAGGRHEHYEHKTVKRPWGAYTVLDLGDGFKVKQVEVKPKRALSLQYHKRRSEHWVVVEGCAKIVKGRKSHLFHANESTYIPVGCIHRLANPSPTMPLKIIEVQAGKYLEEDDIVRIRDDFGRSPE